MPFTRRVLVMVALLTLIALPTDAVAGERPTLTAPGRIFTGEAATLTGTAGTAKVAVQEGTSASGPWRTVVTVPVRSGRFRAVVAPEATRWYRVKARTALSPVRKVAVTAEPDPVYVWRSLQSLGSVAGSAAPSFADEYQVQLGGTYYDETGDASNVVVPLRAASPSAFLEIGLDGLCDRARMQVGLEEPFSQGPASMRVLTDATPVLDRTFGTGQRQTLDLDVAGVRVLRVEASRTGTSGVTYPAAAGVSLHCDHRLGRRLPDTSSERWTPLSERGSIDGSAQPAFSDEYTVDLGGVRFTGGNNLSAKLTASDPSGFVVFDLGGACRRLRVSLGVEEPFSDDASRIRILADGESLVSRDLGRGQRHALYLDVRGVDQLRFDATRLTSEGSSFPAIADPEVYCRR